MNTKSLKQNALIPESVVRKEIKDADLRSAGNRSFYLSMFLALIIAFLVYKNSELAEKAANNLKTIVVKYHIDGTWDVEFPDNEKANKYPVKTVEAILRKYAKYRYSKDQQTIATFYGYVQNMMGKDLYTNFIDKKGVNALSILEETLACNNCNSIKVIPTKQFIYNEYDYNFKEKGYKSVYQTNLYITENKVNPNGKIIESNKKIVNITWRIRNKEEEERYIRNYAKNNKMELLNSILDENPISLVVVSDEVIDVK